MRTKDLTAPMVSANTAEALKTTRPEPLGRTTHDQSDAIASTMAKAEALCERTGQRLTPARRRVLEILLEDRRALGAYEVLERLRVEGLGAQPPAAYRALDFLVTNGLAHRVETLNAFVACAYPDEPHAPAFLLCTACGSVTELRLPSPTSLIGAAAAGAGFDVEETAIEARGICADCKAQPTHENT